MASVRFFDTEHLCGSGAGGLLPEEDEPVRAFLFIGIEAFAIVTADAFTGDDLGAADGAPLALLFADRACVAFRPALDSKDSHV